MSVTVRTDELLALLKRHGVASATLDASGALLSVTFGPDAPSSEGSQHDTMPTPQPRIRSATPRLVDRVDSDS